jgi:hypothetical protein
MARISTQFIFSFVLIREIRGEQVGPHQTPDGQIELDTVATGDVTWVVEIKWQNRPARRADLEHFLARVQAAQASLPQPPDVLWFIARAGFREAALRFARQKNILVSSEQDLHTLAERLGVRFAR